MAPIDSKTMPLGHIKTEDDQPWDFYKLESLSPSSPNMSSKNFKRGGPRTAVSDSTNPYAYYIRGRVVLVTGVSPGSLGAAFVQALADADPAEIILAGRDRIRVERTARALADANPDIHIRLLQLDLLALDSVRRAAGRIMEWADLTHVDVLVNSAGVMATGWALSPDGYESQLAVNHLGPFLFVNLIMPKILKARNPRVVMVGGGYHRLSHFRFADYNFQDGKTYNKWQAYGQSKTANSLMAMWLANKLGATNNMTAFSLHPGFIKTNIDAHLIWEEELPERQKLDRFLGNREGWDEELHTNSIEDGVAMYMYAAFDPYLWPHNGSYLEKLKVGNPLTDTIKPWATSMAEAERLWKLSEQLVGSVFAYEGVPPA